MKQAWIIACLLIVASSLSALPESRFMTYPDIHGDRIVFTYEGDLWLVSDRGGDATRLTTFPGTESMAKFSPDGRWIAFTASYDGSPQVYCLPAEGGAPRRLTYVPGFAQVVTWTPDSRRIVFRSMFENASGRDPNLYFVDLEGSAPERFPLDRGVLCSFSPDGTRILYCRRGQEEYYWKRYKGGRYQDIWLYSFTDGMFAPVSDYVGKNSYPMWVGDTMVFVSDRTNGISNLYAQKIGSSEIRQVTSYADFDVMMPSTDGRRIVFMQDGYLRLMETESGLTNKLAVRLPSDRWTLRPRVINPRRYIHSQGISADGRTVVIEARGDIFLLPVDKGQTRNLSQTPGSRERYPQLSPDGRTVAFFSDRTGEYQIYTQSIEGGEWTPLTTTLDRTNYKLLWSPDGKKILFGNKDYTLFWLDVATRKLIKIDSSNQMKNDEFTWEISDYSWSPDSRWVCYSLVQSNRNSQVFLYNLEQGRRYPVTDDFFDNLHPCFDADGGYLYYLSSRNFDVRMDFYEDNHVLGTPYQVMCVQLRAGEKPPFEEFGATPDAPQAAVESEAEKESAPPAAPAVLRIDLEDLAKRTFPLPVPAGNLFFLKAGPGKVLWSSVPEFTEDEYEEIFKPGGATKWDLHIFDMKKKKETVLTEKIASCELSVDGRYLLFSRQGNVYASSLDKASDSQSPGAKVSLEGMTCLVDPAKEWLQIFNDSWRWYRDFFYDPDMHGRDWKAMGDTYRAYLPQISSRAELNWVLQQMVGELCVSHTYVGGGDMGPLDPPDPVLFTGLLGADFVPDAAAGFYKFDKIYGPTEINADLTGPLVRPDIALREGDYLIAINGREVRPPQDYFELLQVALGQKIRLTVNSRPTAAGAKTYEVLPLRSDSRLRYFRWVTDNVRKVLKASGGRVGYMHITAMGAGGIGEFDKFWRAFRYKDGLIIDVRRNSGGWTEYFLIDKLERELNSFNVLKNMVPFRYPGSAGKGRYVVISNENNGSDGEAFVDHFKSRQLGVVVGTTSWGGLVGIVNGQATIDNGIVHQPNNAFWGKAGEWIVENHGADPDIFVDNDPASAAAGRDAQLEKAIEVALELIEKKPEGFPDRPAYPKK